MKNVSRSIVRASGVAGGIALLCGIAASIIGALSPATCSNWSGVGMLAAYTGIWLVAFACGVEAVCRQIDLLAERTTSVPRP